MPPKIGYKKYTHCKSVGICAKILLLDILANCVQLLVNSYMDKVNVRALTLF